MKILIEMDWEKFLNQDFSEYEMFYLSENPNITLDMIMNHPKLKWNIFNIIKRMTYNEFKISKLYESYLLTIISDVPLSIFVLSSLGIGYINNLSKYNKTITENDILSNFDIKWYYLEIKHLPFDFFFNNRKLLNINNKILSYKAKIKDILKYPDYEWDWNIIGDGLNPEDILNNPTLPWVYHELIYNIKNIDIRLYHLINDKTKYLINSRYSIIYIKKQLIYVVSSSNRITITDVINNPEIDWNYMLLSGNPNIDFKVMEKYDFKWNKSEICKNKMDYPVETIKWKLKWNKVMKDILLFPNENENIN